MALSEEEVELVMSDIIERFSRRHDDLAALFDCHAERVMGIVDQDISAKRRQLLGAAFTHEYSIEGGSNLQIPVGRAPTRPARSGWTSSRDEFLRAIGEGHKSTIEFRVGEINTADHSIVSSHQSHFRCSPKPTPLAA